jgi:hypothetical protein
MTTMVMMMMPLDTSNSSNNTPTTSSPPSHQSLISNSSQRIERDGGLTLTHQYGGHLYVLHLLVLAHVVDQSCRGEEVQSREGIPDPVSRRIIVVSCV